MRPLVCIAAALAAIAIDSFVTAGATASRRVRQSTPATTVTDARGGLDEGEAVAALPDGGFVVAGSAGVADPNQPADFAIVRYTADGVLDAGFGAAGKAFTDFSGDQDIASSVVVGHDGRIVVAGLSQLPTTDRNAIAGGGVGVARYLPDGSPDLSFAGGAGKVRLTDPRLRNCAGLPRLAPAPGGGLVIALSVGCGGEGGGGGSLAVLVLRLRADGRLDRRFGRDGIRRTDALCSAPAIAVQPDGRVLIAGADDETFSSLCSDTATVVMRLTPRGTRDAHFGSRGEVRFGYPRREETGATDVLLDGHGRITLTGYATKDANYDGRVYFALARLRPDGRLDPSFGRDGRTLAKVGPLRRDFAHAIAREPDGRLTVVGASEGADRSDFVVGHFLASGAPDGSTIVHFGASDAEAEDVAVTANGGLVVVGSTAIKGVLSDAPDELVPNDFAVARLADPH